MIRGLSCNVSGCILDNNKRQVPLNWSPRSRMNDIGRREGLAVASECGGVANT